MNRHKLPRQTQAGMVLVISLILLLVLTLVAVVAMRTTTTDLQITTNNMLKTRAFQNSESGRRVSTNVISNHVFYRGWPNNVAATSNFTLPDGLGLVDSSSELWVDKNGESILDDTDADPDMNYQIDGNNDGDFTDQEDINAAIYVTKLATVPAPGSSTNQVQGYEGLGQGAAGGGAYIYFDIRSRGTAPGNARATTGVDYRHVVNN